MPKARRRRRTRKATDAKSAGDVLAPSRRAGLGHAVVLPFAAVLVSLGAAWHLLAAADFLYPTWYDVADIGEHIDEFGPQNRYRFGFHLTTREERERLFGEIVDGIHADGRGLDALVYRDPRGRTMALLLREPEVVHLRDVAKLVRLLQVTSAVAVVVLIAQLGWLRRTRQRLPPAYVMAGAVAGVIAAVGVATVLIGARDVFYVLHEWVFPPDNPWFFYYQDSLMSTMMKAPYLFGYIATALAVLTAAICWGLLWLANRLTRPPPTSSGRVRPAADTSR